MDELFLFYWYGWILIIIIYFFVNNVEAKYFFLYSMFLILLLVHTNIQLFGQINVSGALIVLFISTFYYYFRLQFSFYDIFVTVTVIFCYNALLIWKKIAPIWFVMSPLIMMPLIVCTIITLLISSLYKQVAVAMMGLSIGQLLSAYILVEYGLFEQQGNLYFFTIFFSHILFLIVFRLTGQLYRFVITNTI